MPTFLIGNLALLVLSLYAGWIPPQRYASPAGDLGTNVKEFLLPVSILGLHGGAIVLRMTRAAVLEVLQLDYVRTARAKGLHSRAVLWRHVMANAWPTVIVVVGIVFAQLVAGSVVLEVMFGLPGLGSYLVEAMQTRDYNVIQSVSLVVASSVVVVNAAADVAVGLTDPRIRR